MVEQLIGIQRHIASQFILVQHLKKYQEIFYYIDIITGGYRYSVCIRTDFKIFESFYDFLVVYKISVNYKTVGIVRRIEVIGVCNGKLFEICAVFELCNKFFRKSGFLFFFFICKIFVFVVVTESIFLLFKKFLGDICYINGISAFVINEVLLIAFVVSRYFLLCVYKNKLILFVMLFVIFFELSVVKNERSRVGEKIVVNFFGAKNRKLIFIVIISGISPIFFESAGAAVDLLCRFGVFFCLLEIGLVECKTVFIQNVFFYRHGL